jgi:hypothetical protein
VFSIASIQKEWRDSQAKFINENDYNLHSLLLQLLYHSFSPGAIGLRGGLLFCLKRGMAAGAGPANSALVHQAMIATILARR